MPQQQGDEDGTADRSEAASILGAPKPMEAGDDTDLIFTSLDAFYDEYLAQVVRRRVDGVHLAWCPEWWRHPEAIARMAALWRAFEYLRQDVSLGLSNWWLHHADPHLAALMDPRTGPFVLCSGPGGHSDALGPLPGEPSPPEMWDHPAYSRHATDPDAAPEADPAP
ncbi:DUF4913 domain-containing protein [Streptomyces sp. NPDC013181]|uniref:DUF4913 domain-containing protein n=1 Tax=Streptomyces sp. NPDC013181 TaxID=3364864 RepID=UPI0036763050